MLLRRLRPLHNGLRYLLFRLLDPGGLPGGFRDRTVERSDRAHHLAGNDGSLVNRDILVYKRSKVS